MTSYFQNGALFYFFQLLSTLAPYSGSESDEITPETNPFSYHNIKTELKNLLFRSEDTALQRYIYIFLLPE